MIDIPDNVKVYPVNSTSFTHMGFDKSKQELYIKFNRGAVYKYLNVTQELVQEIFDSNSKGIVLKEKIINNPEEFPFKKI